MRIGAIVVADLNEQPQMGVVKEFDDEGLTARFPISGPSNVVEITERNFTKAEGNFHRLHPFQDREFGVFLRQLTGITRVAG